MTHDEAVEAVLAGLSERERVLARDVFERRGRARVTDGALPPVVAAPPRPQGQQQVLAMAQALIAKQEQLIATHEERHALAARQERVSQELIARQEQTIAVARQSIEAQKQTIGLQSKCIEHLLASVNDARKVISALKQHVQLQDISREASSMGGGDEC